VYEQPFDLASEREKESGNKDMQWVANTTCEICRGKGTPRRNVKKIHKTAGTDDKKLQTALKKLNVQPIQGIEEVNMFKTDGNVIHFSAPKGTISRKAATDWKWAWL